MRTIPDHDAGEMLCVIIENLAKCPEVDTRLKEILGDLPDDSTQWRPLQLELVELLLQSNRANLIIEYLAAQYFRLERNPDDFSLSITDRTDQPLNDAALVAELPPMMRRQHAFLKSLTKLAVQIYMLDKNDFSVTDEQSEAALLALPYPHVAAYYVRRLCLECELLDNDSDAFYLLDSNSHSFMDVQNNFYSTYEYVEQTLVDLQHYLQLTNQ